MVCGTPQTPYISRIPDHWLNSLCFWWFSAANCFHYSGILSYSRTLGHLLLSPLAYTGQSPLSLSTKSVPHTTAILWWKNCPLGPPREESQLVGSLVSHNKSILKSTAESPDPFLNNLPRQSLCFHLIYYRLPLCLSFKMPSPQDVRTSQDIKSLATGECLHINILSPTQLHTLLVQYSQDPLP